MIADKLKLVSWNIRAGGGKRAEGISRQIKEWQADVIGLSEFRGTAASMQLARSLATQGFTFQFNTCNRKVPAMNALLIASRIPIKISRLNNSPDNKQRWLMVKLETNPAIRVGLMHIPNYTNPELKYPYMQAVLDMVDHSRCGPTLIMGDTNCGKRSIDEENPSPTLFRREHDWIEALEDRQWIDSYRHLHGNRRVYSWYSHRNNGFRLDQAFYHPKLIKTLTSANYVWGYNPQQPQRREGLSDHAALIMELDLKLI